MTESTCTSTRTGLEPAPSRQPGPRRTAGLGRVVARVGVGTVCAAGGLVAIAGPAFAEKATEPAKPLGLLDTLGLFVGVPVGAFVLISLLVLAGQLKRRPSHEPDLAWYDEAVSDRPTDAPQVEDGHGSGGTGTDQRGHGQAPA